MNSIAFCSINLAPLRKEASDASEMESQVLFGEPVEIISWNDPWCEVRTYFDNYLGWMDQKQLILMTEKELKRHLDGLQIQKELFREIETPWGNQLISKGAFLPQIQNQEFQIGKVCFKELEVSSNKPANKLIDFAYSYLNVPYMWGGKSPFGIDCSGFTQQVFRAFDIQLPRNASQQIDFGMEVDFEDQIPGDLAFFINQNQKVHHVGIVLENFKIIHASGQVRVDEFTPNGIWRKDKEKITHNLLRIKRI